jgi:hypothetical protein
MVAAPNSWSSGSAYICGCWPTIAQTHHEKDRGSPSMKTGSANNDDRSGD